jgi:uncharacterized protein YxeA
MRIFYLYIIMKYKISISLILIYICIFILINNSHNAFTVNKNEPILKRCMDNVQLYKQNTDTIQNLYNSLNMSNKYTNLIKNNISSSTGSNRKEISSITTNQRHTTMNYKQMYLTNLKIKSVFIGGGFALLILLFIMLTTSKLITRQVLIILMVISIIIIIVVNLFYGFSFNRNNMYMSEFNFEKPTEETANMSKLKYYERLEKCGKKSLETLLDNNKPHHIDMSKYVINPEKCKFKNI